MTKYQEQVMEKAREIAKTFTDEHLREAYLMGVETGLLLEKKREVFILDTIEQDARERKYHRAHLEPYLGLAYTYKATEEKTPKGGE